MRKGGWAGALLLVALALAAGIGAFRTAAPLADAYAGVSVRMPDAMLSDIALRQMIAEEDGTLCLTAAWTRSAPVTVSADSMQTSARLRVIAVLGDMRQVAPMTLLYGSYPTDGDETGCLLDAESARALFHSTEVAGAAVFYNGARYTVRGVVQGGEAMMLIRDKNARYENMEFSVPDLDTGRAAVNAFLYRHALSDEAVIIENGLYARILHGLCFLPAEMLLLAAGARLLGCALRRRERRLLQRLPLLLGALLCLFGAAGTLYATFTWPGAFLPTACSDFAFWGTLLDGWRDAWEAMAQMTPLPRETFFFRAMRRGLCLAASSAVAGLWALDRFRPDRRDV